MMRWLSWIVSGAMGLGMASGCGHKVFLGEREFADAHHLIPGPIEEGQPLAGAIPLMAAVGTPADVNNAERPARYMTLQEAIAIALESGSSGGRSAGGVGSGIADDSLVQFLGGSTNNQTDKVRVLAMNPAISAASLEASLARYDAMVVSTLNWAVTDSLSQGLASFSNGQEANFNMSIVKAFASGGVSSIGLQNNYRHLSEPPSGVFNPFYTTRFTIGFEQPLWRNFGTEINQLLNSAPGATGGGVPGDVAGAYNSRQEVLRQGPNFGGFPTEGILVARLRLDAQKSEFERNINNMLLNVEVAYWNLYQAYGQLYSFEEVMRIAHRTWLIHEAKFQAGTVGPQIYYPILGQYQEFRGQRLAALGEVLDRERNLRRILGLPIEDGSRVVPITPPTLAPFIPDWQSARQDALLRRPEMAIARDNLRGAQYNLINQQNFLKPDLRFVAQYVPVGFGTRLDGNGILPDGGAEPQPSNALRSLTDNNFNDWRLGLNFTMPLGFRTEHAAVRAARLGLAQAYEALKDQEDRATSALTAQYQKLSEWYRLIEARRAERKAYAAAVEARYREYAAGKQTVADFLLEAQRRLAAAQVKEYEAIAQYNNSLARFEWTKGTIMNHDNVHIAEGALPPCAQVRAVEHERDRSMALVLCERADSIYHPGRMVAGSEKDVICGPADGGGAGILAPAEEGYLLPRLPPPATMELRPLPPAPAEIPQFVPVAPKVSSQTNPALGKRVMVQEEPMGTTPNKHTVQPTAQPLIVPPTKVSGVNPTLITLPDVSGIEWSPSVPVLPPPNSASTPPLLPKR